MPQGPIDRATLRAMLIDGRLDEGALAAAIAGDGWHPAAIARRLLGRLDEVALSRRGFEAWAFDLSADCRSRYVRHAPGQ